jgi:hypothetical protein
VKSSLPIWVQKPFLPRWRAPVSSTEIQSAWVSPARNTSRASATKASLASVRIRTTCRLEISSPSASKNSTRRGTVVWPWWYWARMKRLSSGPKWSPTPDGSGATTVRPSGVSQRSRR